MIVSRNEVLAALGGSLSTTDQALLNVVQPEAEETIKGWLQQNLELQQYTEFVPCDRFLRPRGDLVDWEKVGSVIVPSPRHTFTGYTQLRQLPVLSTGTSGAYPLVCYEDIGANAGQNPNGAWASDTQLTLGTDYWLDAMGPGQTGEDSSASFLSDTGLLWRVINWPVEARTVKVIYWAGLDAATIACGYGGLLRTTRRMIVHCFYEAKAQVATMGGVISSESIGEYSRAFAQPSGDKFDIPPGIMEGLWKFLNMGRIAG